MCVVRIRSHASVLQFMGKWTRNKKKWFEATKTVGRIRTHSARNEQSSEGEKARAKKSSPFVYFIEKYVATRNWFVELWVQLT